MIISYRDIINYYQDIFALKEAGYSLTEINKMTPYEMDIYSYLEIEKREKAKNG